MRNTDAPFQFPFIKHANIIKSKVVFQNMSLSAFAVSPGLAY